MPAGAGPIVVANVRLDRVEVAMSRRTQLQIDLGRRRGLAKNELVATCQLQADRTPDMARETCDQRFQLHDLAAEAAPPSRTQLIACVGDHTVTDLSGATLAVTTCGSMKP